MNHISDIVRDFLPDSIKSVPVAVYLPEATDQSLEAMRSSFFESGITVTRNYSESHQLSVIINSNNELLRSGRNSYIRRLEGTITVSVYDKKDTLLWSKTSQLNYSDSVSKDIVDKLTSDWSISQFDRIEHRRNDRIILNLIKPLIISGAVATTVVLLFSVRSQ